MSVKTEDARLTAVSGFGGTKLPACFLLEGRGSRILIDLGEGPDEGVVADVSGVGRVDALVLSHGHGDHAGALRLLPQVGDPPVYAAEPLLPRLPKGVQGRPLSPGANEIAGIPLVTGRPGHAPGAFWLRFGIGGGLLYMGDHCRESCLFAYDAPPRSRCVILDASYGTDDTPQEQRIAEFEAALSSRPLLLPLPAYGRAAEVALHLARSGRQFRVCESIRAALRWMADTAADWLCGDTARELLEVANLAPPAGDEADGLVLAAAAQCEKGASARLARGAIAGDGSPAILFTGYVSKGTPAATLVAAGRAGYCCWNVHARLSENVDLVRSTGAEVVMPCFCDIPEVNRIAPLLAPARTVTQNVFSWS